MLLIPNWRANASTLQTSTSARLAGGIGDDVLVYDPQYKHIDGGPGYDTLRVTLAANLDLVSTKQLFNIEAMDLSPAGGGSTVVLDWHEIMRLTSSPHVLRIQGALGDTVQGGSGWSDAGTVVEGGHTYARYTQNAATLLVDNEVQRSGIVDHAPDAKPTKS